MNKEVFIEPEPILGLDRRVFRRTINDCLEWCYFADWEKYGERARFYGFTSKILPWLGHD